jgi:hypothetical protein
MMKKTMHSITMLTSRVSLCGQSMSDKRANFRNEKMTSK